jgi:glucose/arabinose dehydrogenase
MRPLYPLGVLLAAGLVLAGPGASNSLLLGAPELRVPTGYTAERYASGLKRPTAMAFGPDGRLYVAQQDGLITVYSVVRRVDGHYAVSATEEITAVQRIPNHDDDGSSISDLSSMLGVVEQKLENAGLL